MNDGHSVMSLIDCEKPLDVVFCEKIDCLSGKVKRQQRQLPDDQAMSASIHYVGGQYEPRCPDSASTRCSARWRRVAATLHFRSRYHPGCRHTAALCERPLYVPEGLFRGHSGIDAPRPISTAHSPWVQQRFRPLEGARRRRLPSQKN